ncbi:RNA polymerase II transcription factor B subunit 1, partial [Dipsacomyces acuminosporus]
QVSKADAKKVMLRISVAPPNSAPNALPTLTYTFTWRNPNKEASLADREKYVTELSIVSNRRAAVTAAAGNGAAQQQNGQASGQASSAQASQSQAAASAEYGKVKIGAVPASADEVKLRQDVLSKNAELAKLHQSLVLSGLISEDEFWSTRKHILETHAIQLQLRKGESSTWLDLAPDTQDGGNFKYTITPNIARRIFKEYPQVRKAYMDNVPHKIGEKQFWKRFLASRFFNRSRSTSAMKGNPDSIFDECLRDEDKLLSDAKRIDSEFIISLLDLRRTEEDSVETGNALDFTMRPGRYSESLSLIRRFNHHSEMVLQSALKSKRKQAAPSSSQKPASATLGEAIVLDDLELAPAEKKVKLKIQDQTRYFTSLSKSDISSSGSGRHGQDPNGHAAFSVSFDISRPLGGCGDPQKSMGSLLGSVRRLTLQSRPNRIEELNIPDELNKAVAECHGAGTEMLRHLWALLRMPPTAERRQKAEKIVAAFDGVHRRIRETITKANSAESSSGGVNLGSIIEQMLQPIIESLSAGKKAFEARRL